MVLTEFDMPKLGHLMEEGRVVRWAKAQGQPIAKGETLLEVEMEKAVLEVESPVAGVLHMILVTEGESVPVGAPLALIQTPDA